MRRKSKAHEEHENHERLLVSYADFITLLFAFFVVLYATSSQNVEKEKKFEESIRENLKLPASGAPGGGGGGPGGGAPTLAQQAGLETPRASADSQERLASNAEYQEKLEKEIGGKFTDAEKQTVTSLRHDLFGVRMSLAASMLFPTGSAKIRREALPVLDKIAQLMKGNQFKMLVEGHTDDQAIPAGGQFDSNWELGSARATQVVRYLAKVHSIPESRLAAVSYADQRPLAPNKDEESRAKNRRIEILFVTGDSPFDEF